MATAQRITHDYHLVDPSQWPIVGSIAAFFMAVGAIMLDAPFLCRRADRVRHRRRSACSTPWQAGGRDVIQRGRDSGRPHPRGADQPPLRHDPVHRLRGDVLRRLVLGVLQCLAVPGGCGSCHARCGVRLRSRHPGGACNVPGTWPPKGINAFDPWHLPLLNTLILLTSGTTVTWAHNALLNNDRRA